MKEDKYEFMRSLLTKYMGSPILRIIKENQKELDMDPDVFDLVYEGFWDLYTMRPKLMDVRSKKLLEFISKIKLTSGPERESDPVKEPEAAEEGKEEEEEVTSKTGRPDINIETPDVIDPIVAVVRLKIPKVPLEPELDEDGQEIPVEVDESDLEDMPFDDRCLTMVSKIEDQRVWVINHTV